MRALGDFNEEYLEAAKRLFLGGMSLDDIAEQSEELLGMPIARDRLNGYSVKYKWVVEKGQNKSKQSDDVKVQVDTIRNIIFAQIVAESESGLLISLEKNQYDLVTGFLDEKKITYKDVPCRINPQLVNSFMGLLTDSKGAGIENLGRTAKTSRQQVLEEARRAIEESRQ
jgi:hypothetical protein